MRYRTYPLLMSWWMHRKSGSSVEWAARKQAYEIPKGAGWTWSTASDTIAHRVLLSEYWSEPVFMRKRSQIPFYQWLPARLAMFYQLAVKVHLVWSAAPSSRRCRSQAVCVPMLNIGVCSVIGGRVKHRKIYFRLTCIRALEFWWLLMQAL